MTAQTIFKEILTDNFIFDMKFCSFLKKIIKLQYEIVLGDATNKKWVPQYQ